MNGIKAGMNTGRKNQNHPGINSSTLDADIVEKMLEHTYAYALPISKEKYGQT
jgi:hypothetical protein